MTDTRLPDMRRRVTAEFVIGVSPNYSEPFVLLSDEALAYAEREENAELQIRTRSAIAAGHSMLEIERQKADFIACRKEKIAEHKRERDAALPTASAFQFILVLPFLKDWQRIIDVSNQIAQGDTQGWSEEKEEKYHITYREMLLKNDGVEIVHGKPLSAQYLDGLPPVITAALGIKMAAALASDPRRRMLILPSPRKEN